MLTVLPLIGERERERERESGDRGGVQPRGEGGDRL